MTENETIQLIELLNDYADKQNKSSLKNILLVALFGILGTIIVGVVGYAFSSISVLQGENSELKDKVARLEVQQDVAMKEQNRILFKMLEKDDGGEFDGFEEFSGDDDGFETPLEGAAPPPEPVEEMVNEEEKFQKFNRHIQQRVQDQLPPMPEHKK